MQGNNFWSSRVPWVLVAIVTASETGNRALSTLVGMLVEILPWGSIPFVAYAVMMRKWRKVRGVLTLNVAVLLIRYLVDNWLRIISCLVLLFCFLPMRSRLRRAVSRSVSEHPVTTTLFHSVQVVSNGDEMDLLSDVVTVPDTVRAGKAYTVEVRPVTYDGDPVSESKARVDEWQVRVDSGPNSVVPSPVRVSWLANSTQEVRVEQSKKDDNSAQGTSDGVDDAQRRSAAGGQVDGKSAASKSQERRVESLRSEFVVRKMGVYRVSVWLGPKRVSQQMVTAIAGDFEPSVSRVELKATGDEHGGSGEEQVDAGVALHLQNTPLTLVVKCRDAHGNEIRESCLDPSRLALTLNGRTCTCVPVDNANGTYDMLFTCTESGFQVPSVTYGDVQLVVNTSSFLVLNAFERYAITQAVAAGEPIKFVATLEYFSQLGMQLPVDDVEGDEGGGEGSSSSSSSSSSSASPSLVREEHAMVKEGKEVECVLSDAQMYVVENSFWKMFDSLFPTWRLASFKVRRSVLMRPVEGDLECLMISDTRNVMKLRVQKLSTTIKNASLDQINLPVLLTGVFMHHRDSGCAENLESRRRKLKEQIMPLNVSSQRVVLEVDRNNLIESSQKALESLTGVQWRREFRVRFKGEPGVDAGGLSREWFTLLAKAMFGDRSGDGMFVPLDEEQSDSSLMHPNPEFKVTRKGFFGKSDRSLELFEFAGRFVAKSIWDTTVGRAHLIPCSFTRSFRKQVCGIPVSFSDFAQDQPQTYTSMRYILEHSVEDLDMTFVASETVDGKVVETPLRKGGDKMAVTDGNKWEFLQMLADHTFRVRAKAQIEAFCTGFYSVLPENLIALFDEQELELLISGSPVVDVKDMRKHTTMEGLSSQVREWFWLIVDNMGNEDRAKLLQFITGTSQIPLNGFADLNPRLKVRSKGSDSEEWDLPSAATCFNTLKIPEYPEFHIMEARILTAVREGCEGFDFS